MIGKVRQYIVSSVIFMAVFGLLTGASSIEGKRYKGHPVTFDPDSISVEMALNGCGRQTISLTSHETLQDVTVRILGEIYPFVSAGAYELGTLEAGWGYELDLDFVTPEDTAPGTYEGTIHLRVGNRTLAKPLPVTIEVMDEWVSLSDWRYRRCDLASSACNPIGSSVATGDSLNLQFTIPGADHYILSGDVDGDWENEIITTSGRTLNIYSGRGELEQSIDLPRECQLSMLEDVDGDGVLDIGLGSWGDGFAAYIYKSDGTLLKTIEGAHGGWYGDHSMIPLTLSNGKMLVGYNAGYSRTPRGLASFDYDTGIEEWYYQVGPANGWYSVVDMDLNGVLDITMNAHTVHNGASGNGTTDGDIYLMVVDELGASPLTQKYPSPSNGWAMHMFADMNGDGVQEILGFEGHDPGYYPGQAQIHIYDNTGNTLHTFNGPSNTGWDYAVGDLDGDDVPEIVASAQAANQVYVLDNELQLLDSVSAVGNVKLICDLTGDGTKEIVLLDSDGWVRILDLSLSVVAEVKCGDKNGNAIASDVDGDGIVELLVPTDQLYVLSFAKDTVSADETSNESVPVEDILSVPAIVESDEAGVNANNDKERPIVIESQPEAADRYKLIRGEYTWHEAKADAETRGGYLVTVTSAEEWEIICSLFDADFRQMVVWLGATDEKEEGVWKWVTGEPFTFNAWNPGEPNNDYDGAEDYLHVYRYDDFVPSKSWNDCVVDHYIADGYVMEIEQVIGESDEAGAKVANEKEKAIVIENEPEPAVSGASDGELEDGIKEFNGHYYRVFTERRSWSGAKEECERMGGYLACITSRGENDFIVNLARDNEFPEFTCAWIGASDADRESEWSWISGEPLLMEDNLLSHGGEHENYLNLRLATGQWEDYPLEGEPVGEQWFVCEWGPEMVGDISGAETIMIESATHHLGDQRDHEGSVFSKSFHLDATYETANLNIDFVEPWGPNIIHPTQISINGISVGSLLPHFPPRSDPNWYGDDYNGAFSATFPVAHLLVEGTNVFRIQNGTPADDFYFNNVHLVVGTPTPSITKERVQNAAADDGSSEHDGAVGADAVRDLSGGQADDEFHEQKPRFMLIEGRFTWDEARADAEARGGHLATFTSQAEWDEMVEQVGITALSECDSWIGGTDERKEGVWEWATGEPFEFSRWDRLQPDNTAWCIPDIPQHYTVIIPYNLLWDDRGSVERTLVPRFPYVLEVEQNDLESDDTFAQVEINRLAVTEPQQDKAYETDSQNTATDHYVKVADSVEDFSGAQGSNGWYYGYSEEGGFKIFPDFDGSSWGINSSYWTSIWRDGTHPNSIITSGGKLPANHTTIRRWICPEEGQYQIKGTLEESGAHPAADGVTVAIAGQMYELNEGDLPIEFQFDTYLDAGDIVDIELAPNSNDFTDGTYTKVEIYRLGAPAPKHGEAVETYAQGDLSDSQAVVDRIEPSIQPDSAASLDTAIQGVWELPFDDGSVRYKTIEDGKWLVEQRDPETGEMVYRHGGSYSLDGNSYTEHVEYANESTAFLVGNSYTFEVSVDRDALHQVGIGNPWTEDWYRASSGGVHPNDGNAIDVNESAISNPGTSDANQIGIISEPKQHIQSLEEAIQGEWKIRFDVFNHGRIGWQWNMFSNGCSIVELDGVLSIQGTTEVEGWGNGNGLESEHFWPEGDFDVSVDFMAPEFSGRGTRLVYLMARGSNSESVGLFYSYNIGYRVQTWEPSQFSTWLEPFGDEDSAYHTMRLVYDTASETLTGYVDDFLVGSLNIQMGGDVCFTIQTASESADMTIDAQFDNFMVKPWN